MNTKLISSLIGCTLLSACAVSPQSTTVEVREYRVPKDNQIQLVASDLAVELDVAGIEWNTNLRPWDYRTLRSRSIYLTDTTPQKAYIELFTDTGLLPLYDQRSNRIVIEPFATKLKETTKFEPSFTKASLAAANEAQKQFNDSVSDGELHEYQMYEGDSMRTTLNSWARQEGIDHVVWYISDQKQIDALLKPNRRTSTVYERGPLNAIHALLENINASTQTTNINFRIFKKENTLVFHGLKKGEPMMLFDVKASDTRAMAQSAADAYKANLNYTAPVYRISEPYTTVLTSRVEPSVQQLFHGYPLKAVYKESTNTIHIESVSK
ncbi:hypothetical protein [Vibrio agarivorans]|uniref:Uncharacterized protein n=1 Tax=Vibrio agarivorans TaxID=153622 RepID=A0ABT7Y881_9VIBR|nr:hypothetical protein [Vibrio agarivorans]MDN2483964.1 hypothetical protein [Vibrio agarivorans]